MCFENSVSNRKNNEANTSDQNEKCETSGTCYSKHSEHTSQPKMNLENLETNSAPAHQFHQTSKKMAEKVKKLPPGYVNVSTKDPAFPTRTNSYDENKKESSNATYVNTTIRETNLESPFCAHDASQNLDDHVILGNNTNTFKFGLDPEKPDMPYDDSEIHITNITTPPPKQKLSPQEPNLSLQRSSLELCLNDSQSINNDDVISTSAIKYINISKSEDQISSNGLIYPNSKASSLSSTFSNDDLLANNDEMTEEIIWGSSDIQSQFDLRQSFSLSRSPNSNHRAPRLKTTASSEALQDSLKPSSRKNKENMKLDHASVSAPKKPHVNQKPFEPSNLEYPIYQNSTILKERIGHGNNIIPNDSAHENSLFTSAPPTPLRNSSSLASKNSTISKQYVNSAGGGCVSPVGDASPHILISSENHFPYNQSEIFGVNTDMFLSTNPFLPMIKMKQEQEFSWDIPKNPFVQISRDEKRNKCHTEIVRFPQKADSDHVSSQVCKQPSEFLKLSSDRNQNETPPRGTVQMHHHHFFHGIHQLNVNSGYDQNFNQSLTMVPQSSFPTFTPNPSINFPSAVDENVSQHPNLNHTNNIVNPQFVLKPKKEATSYKDLECLFAHNKALLNKCGWYYGSMRADESTALLSDTPPGTFLIRDSSDPKYWFSLSMQRGCSTNDSGEWTNLPNSGPTSIRILCVNGKFKLDSENKISNLMPEFSTIIDLVQYYVLSSLQELSKLQIAQTTIPNNGSKSFQNAKSKTLWVDCSGKLYQTIFLAYPLYKKDRPQGLSHLCRLSINNSIVSKISNNLKDNINSQYLESVSMLKLPSRIQEFLQEYPNFL